MAAFSCRSGKNLTVVCVNTHI